jgi:hypothetical protein
VASSPPAPARASPGGPGGPGDPTDPTTRAGGSDAGARAGPTARSSRRTTPGRARSVPPQRFAHSPSSRVANTTYRLPVCMPSSPHEAPLTALRTSVEGPMSPWWTRSTSNEYVAGSPLDQNSRAGGGVTSTRVPVNTTSARSVPRAIHRRPPASAYSASSARTRGATSVP